MNRRGKSRKPRAGPAHVWAIERHFGPCGSTRRLSLRESRVIDGAMGGPRRLFGTESLQRMAPAAIRWSLAAQKLPPYRSLVHRYVGRISTNDLVTTPKALIEEPIRD
jgi:hypothetical protein